jgi:hypothetical protein
MPGSHPVPMPAYRRFRALTGAVRASNSEHSNVHRVVAALASAGKMRVCATTGRKTLTVPRKHKSRVNTEWQWLPVTLKHRTVSAQCCFQQPVFPYNYAHHHEAQGSPAGEANSRPPSHDFSGIYEPDCSLPCPQQPACGTEPHIQ